MKYGFVASLIIVLFIPYLAACAVRNSLRNGIGWLKPFLSLVILLAACAGVSHGQCIYDLSASWCGPCQQMKPIVKALNDSGVRVETIDVDQQPQKAAELGYRGRIPMFVAVDASGRAVSSLTNMQSESTLRQMWASISTQRPASSNNPACCRVSVADGTMGSGTLVGKDSVVVTCAHLFDDCKTQVICTFPDGRRFGARIIEIDQPNDLAAVEIQPTGITPLEAIDTDPDGELTAGGYGSTGKFAVVQGRIVARPTPNGAQDPSGVINGAVRPGDSGGPVVNCSCKFVGVVWGQRDGQTYFTCGRPLRSFLGRVCGRQTVLVPVQPQNPAIAPSRPSSPASPSQASGCNCGPQFASINAQLLALRAELNEMKLKAPTQAQPSTLNFLGHNNKVVATATITPGAASNVSLPPINFRVLDQRGAGYSTEYQPARLGQFVTLPFGPAQ